MGRIFTGDALKVLKTLPAGLVQTCITSPPYFGLRDYGVEGQVGVGTFFDCDLRSADLHAQLLSVKQIVFMDRELAGVLSLLDDIADDLDVSRCRILVAGAGRTPLAEIARLEVGLEDDFGRRGAENA